MLLEYNTYYKAVRVTKLGYTLQVQLNRLIFNTDNISCYKFKIINNFFDRMNNEKKSKNIITDICFNTGLNNSRVFYGAEKGI